jgi:hypothetical protein
MILKIFPYGAFMKSIKTTLLGLFLSLLFLGCSSNETNTVVEPQLVVNNSLAKLSLNDQNEKPHTITNDTQTLIFAFSKDMGHACNDFFETKPENYLQENNAFFIADVSGAPSVIRSMFIMPGLKDFKHTVLVIDDKSIAANYKAGVDSEKIIIVELDNNIITSIQTVSTAAEMAALLEK